MEEMRKKYYPYHENSKNYLKAIQDIKIAMQRGDTNIEFWTYWTDLPDDWVIEFETLDRLKEEGFKVTKRYCDKGTNGEHFWYIVSWDKFEPWPYDEEY